MTALNGRSVVVVGGSRGLGRTVAGAARSGGATVTVVTRDSGVRGDAADEAFADKVLAEIRPAVLVVTAGALPVMRPLTGHTWETYSVHWHADVRIAFIWVRAALRLPLAPGSRVIVFGSAAELRGSPLSGGYAGAKAAVRMLTGHAREEGRDLGITATTVLPVITPGTGVWEVAIRAYGARSGSTPEFVGAAVAELMTVPAPAAAYLLDPAGVRPVDG